MVRGGRARQRGWRRGRLLAQLPEIGAALPSSPACAGFRALRDALRGEATRYLRTVVENLGLFAGGVRERHVVVAEVELEPAHPAPAFEAYLADART